MTPLAWPTPTVDGAAREEYALAIDEGREWRALIIPALFDEGNRMRRLTLDVMRRLDGAGVDCLLPDLPGLNESLEPLAEQTPAHWRAALASAAARFEATHVLALRGGGLLCPDHLPAWRYAPVNGATILRQMLRARILAAREAGREETQEALLAAGRERGVTLAGYALGPEFVRAFESLTPPASPRFHDVAHDLLGADDGPLWLRAEPGSSRAQADALAAIFAIGIKAT